MHLAEIQLQRVVRRHAQRSCIRLGILCFEIGQPHQQHESFGRCETIDTTDTTSRAHICQNLEGAVLGVLSRGVAFANLVRGVFDEISVRVSCLVTV